MDFDRNYPLLRYLRRSVLAWFRRPARMADIHGYWRNPSPANRPETYAGEHNAERSRYLLELMRRHARPTDRVLEIGCNIGRNLHFLHEGGFTRLSAVEINEEALALLRQTYPDTAARASLHVGPAETVLRGFAPGAFDVIYTMAVLIHVHPEGESVFDEIARIGPRVLVTIEDEYGVGGRHFARNYGKVFSQRGYRQLERRAPAPGLPATYVARVFVRAA